MPPEARRWRDNSKSTGTLVTMRGAANTTPAEIGRQAYHLLWKIWTLKGDIPALSRDLGDQR